MSAAGLRAVVGPRREGMLGSGALEGAGTRVSRGGRAGSGLGCCRAGGEGRWAELSWGAAGLVRGWGSLKRKVRAGQPGFACGCAGAEECSR